MTILTLKDAIFKAGNALKGSTIVFKKPLNFCLQEKPQLAIIGDSFKTEFLSILCGKYTCTDPRGRLYPMALEDTRFKAELLRFVNNGEWGHGAHDASGGFTHLSSRYEFFKDLEIDEVVSNFVSDQSYNSNIQLDQSKIADLVNKLELSGLENQFITTLSNGQFRRARIAKELYRNPNLLCIDDPFLGLDPNATETVSNVLRETSMDKGTKTSIVIGLRIQDELPDWIKSVVVVNKNGIVCQGLKNDTHVKKILKEMRHEFNERHQSIKSEFKEKLHALKLKEKANNGNKISLIEMTNVNIKYKGKPIIKDLNWEVLEGEKWHVRGKNGSGKTTLLSLITLDHPQSWKSSIKVFGVARSPGKVNYFDTNKEIGFTSPELHAIFPKKLTVEQVVSTGYVVGSYIPPVLSAEQKLKISKYLKLMNLDPNVTLGELSTSRQKLTLLIRAIINDPKILILDEALSAMTDEDVIKGKSLVNHWPGTCLIIGHVDQEVPKCDKFILVNEIKDGRYEIGEC